MFCTLELYLKVSILASSRSILATSTNVSPANLYDGYHRRPNFSYKGAAIRTTRFSHFSLRQSPDTQSNLGELPGIMKFSWISSVQTRSGKESSKWPNGLFLSHLHKFTINAPTSFEAKNVFTGPKKHRIFTCSSQFIYNSPIRTKHYS